MESRCSLIRGNVTDKTWASRYTSAPAIEQLLLPDFIVSLVHKSQLPRRAGPRRPAPTIIKIELSLIESSRFSPEYFWCFCRLHFCLNEQLYSPLSGSYFWLPPPSFPLISIFIPAFSAAWKCCKTQSYNDLPKHQKQKKRQLLIPGNHIFPWITFPSEKKKYIFTSQKIACIQLLVNRKAHLHFIAASLLVEDPFSKYIPILPVNKCWMLPTLIRASGHCNTAQKPWESFSLCVKWISELRPWGEALHSWDLLTEMHTLFTRYHIISQTRKGFH